VSGVVLSGLLGLVSRVSGASERGTRFFFLRVFPILSWGLRIGSVCRWFSIP